jgi:chromosome partitioning protein
VVAVSYQKGGCGKTTTSINLAACLARLGHRTLLVDMDPQGHCGVGLAVPEEQIERTIYDAIIEPGDGRVAKVSEVVWQIASDFDLAPSNLKLAAFEQVFAGRPGREDRLMRALQAVGDTYEWCIIDCPPSVGLLTFNALRACNEVLVPVETGYFSLHGLGKVMETLEELKELYNRDVHIRVLPTLYDTRTKLAREVLSELRAKFREYLMESTVNFNTKLKEAASFGQPITEYDPGSRGYKDFVNLARELMGHRPLEVEPAVDQKLSRPAELVQRARQLAQLTNAQFGRGTVQFTPNLAPHAQPASRLGTSGTLIPAAEEMAGSVATATRNATTLVIPQVEPSRTTQQKIDAFYGVKQVDGAVLFSTKFEKASQVLVAGDFNHWTPTATPMSNTTTAGQWIARLPLRPGRYRYRLVVDGAWMTDPHNTYVEANEYGELNNIVEVA